ncbi:CDC42 rho GTPase-activating protein [Thelephora ganbajun]|uniref:CDC42 rho GTPase-activating protein n=1 Tax=Thelephora ganbajun TaxID=370292 RepID=A0ACB6Z1T2_THEGA|nr:CDC42 rho GTPase-activating protein [Thelephora ganbajun]
MAPTNLTLKQRLAALATATSSPTAPYDAPPKSPGVDRRRAFFNPTWIKRPGGDGSLFGGESSRGPANDKLQEVMGRMIYQAGVDFETLPMVVMNASALPDPREVNYDQLLARILSYLNLYVEADYTVIFFAAGARHNPGWNWVWKAYRGLNRKYRKNLKKLFIVHSNFFTKMLFSLAGAIISPKFFRKISYIDTLSELARHVPLTQIDIPAAVYKENSKLEKEIVLPTPTRANIFAVPLEDLMGYDGEKDGIPRVIKDSMQYLRETGLEEEGLFRRSPNLTLLNQVADAYDRGHVVSLDTFNDPNLAAVLIKKFLRDLPTPIFPERTYPVIQRCPIPSDELGDGSVITYVRETILPELHKCSYILLSHVLQLAHEVSIRSTYNRMDAHNLALVLTPNLAKSSNFRRDLEMCAVPSTPGLVAQLNAQTAKPSSVTLGLVIKICISHYYEVFDEVVDRTEAIPPQLSTSSFTVVGLEPTSATASSFSSDISGTQVEGDDESIDDQMLVMPLGPTSSGTPGNRANGLSPPSAWSSHTTISTSYKPRQRTAPSKGSNQSLHTTSGVVNVSVGGNLQGTVGKAKSMISIEKGTIGGGPGGRKGSISIGRGTTRKSTGSGVEAIGITANGFFLPPENSPPVPSKHR